jgi:hypothetical protein
LAVGLAVVSLTVQISPASAITDEWTSVGLGAATTISGIAPATSGWVVVRDNKKATQNRVALLDDNATVTPLTWPGTPPVDLESVDAVPGRADTYAVLASAGTGWLLTAQPTGLTLIRPFTLPTTVKNVESFALADDGGVTVAVWATRGSTTAAAKVFAATFDPDSGTFGPTSTGKVRVPYPTTSVRQVSDLKVVSGRLIAASTSDPGSTGPFTSALYDVGSVTLSLGNAVLQLQTPVELGRYDGHKVEGIACANGVGILGSDDEKAGGAVRTAAFCG